MSGSGGLGVRRSWLRLFLSGVLLLGLLVGWLVWSGTGARLLHRELETELSRRLDRRVALESLDLRLERGLRLSVRNLRVHATHDAALEPLLRAGRVVAWLDIPALLIGRIALRDLVLEGPSLRIERAADGSLVGLPIAVFTGGGPPRKSRPDDVYGEGLVRAVEALEPAAQDLAAKLRFANRIEIRDGTLSFVDRTRAPDALPIRLELLKLVQERNWLSDAGSLALEAVVVDGRNAPFPIRFGVQREEDAPFVWDLSFEGVSLTAARQLVPSLPLLNGLSGHWSAKVHASRDTPGASALVLVLESRVEKAALALPQNEEELAIEALDFAARIELDAKEVRLREARLGGSRIRSDFEVHVERPLRPASSARLEARLVGVQFEDLRELVDSIEREFETARSMYRLVERVESGRIERIEASGTAKLRDWQALWRGPERELPEGFLLSGTFDQVNVAVGSPEEIRDLSGEVEWLGDKLVLSHARARFRDAWLPTMDLALDGVSHLVRATRKAPRVTRLPPPIPGLRPLARILRPRDPNALPVVKAIGLAIERLEHPLLRWPLEQARVLIVPIRRGVQINVREGILGGTAVAGEIVYSSEPDDGKLSADLSFRPPEPAAAIAGASQAQPDWPEGRWGEGEVEIEFRPRPKLPFARATGFARLEGAELVARDVEIALAPQGTIETRGAIGLANPDSIALDLSFALTDGRFESLCEFIALPPKFATGDFGATGTLAGPVIPDRPFVAELKGSIRAEARAGRVALGVPLLLRLSRATEGYNPFANEDEIGYETMAATIGLDHGRLDSEDFTLEGPLRAYARAKIDTNPRPVGIDAVVGIFLFRAPNQILANLPILRSLLPGSERGLVGAYFRVDGDLREPEIEALPLATFLTAVPSAIKAPMKVLQYLFNQGSDGSKSKRSREADPPRDGRRDAPGERPSEGPGEPSGDAPRLPAAPNETP